MQGPLSYDSDNFNVYLLEYDEFGTSSTYVLGRKLEFFESVES